VNSQVAKIKLTNGEELEFDFIGLTTNDDYHIFNAASYTMLIKVTEVSWFNVKELV
jgi:hypothetical protein